MKINVKWLCLLLVFLTASIKLTKCRQQQHGSNENNREIVDIVRKFDADSSEDVINANEHTDNESGNNNGKRRGHRKKHHHHRNQNSEDNDISLWINEQQLIMLSGNVFLPNETNIY